MNRTKGILLTALCLILIVLLAQAERLKGLRPSAVTSLDGLTLAAVESGNTAGPAILFVHGFSQSAASWRQQMHSDLGDIYHLIAFDLRGHGSSSKPEDPDSYVASCGPMTLPPSSKP